MDAMFASSACAVQMLLVAFFAADVLFARASARRSAGFPRDPSRRPRGGGHLAFEFVALWRERRVRTPLTQWHTKALRAADGDVRAKFPQAA